MSAANLDAYNLAQVPLDGLIKESVLKAIYDISKIPLPLTDMIQSGSHGNAYHSWTLDELAPPVTDNAAIDGQDMTGNDSRTGSRVGNQSQTSTKIVQVSTRAIESDTIGRSNELSYQLELMSLAA